MTEITREIDETWKASGLRVHPKHRAKLRVVAAERGLTMEYLLFDLLEAGLAEKTTRATAKSGK